MSQESHSTKIVAPGSNTKGPRSGGVVCYYCPKLGHVIRDCKKL